MHPYLGYQVAMDRQQESNSRASQLRRDREASALRRAAQPDRRSRLAIRFPLRLKTRVVA